MLKKKCLLQYLEFKINSNSSSCTHFLPSRILYIEVSSLKDPVKRVEN